MLRVIGTTLTLAALLGTSAFALDAAVSTPYGAGALSEGSGQAKKVEMHDVILKNKSKIKGSTVAGNTGIEVKGEKIKMKHVLIKNKSKIKDSEVAGNTGVSVRGEKTKMKHVIIKNKSKIKNSTVAGNTGTSIGN